MKRMFVALALAWSSFAFGNTLTTEGKLNFAGHWRTHGGVKGTWESTVTLEKVSGNEEPTVIRMSSDLTVHHGQEVYNKAYAIDLAVTGDGFFDVKVGDAVVGSGYCHPHVCHMSYNNAEGEMVEETYAQGPRKTIFVIGSNKSEEHGTVAWRGRTVCDGDCGEGDDNDDQDNQK